MELSGIYRFYQNGELIGEAENSMTEMGRILAVKTIMGAIPNFATSMGVGVSSTANDTADATTKLIPDYKLGLMVATMPVIGTNITSSTAYDALLFKGRLADPLYYKIHEIGLFSDPLLSGSTGYKQELVLGFENNDNLYSVDASAYLNADGYSNTSYRLVDRTEAIYGGLFRIGRKALLLAGDEEVYTENSFIGLDEYDPTDELTVGFYASAAGKVVTVKFYSGSSASESITFTFGQASAGANQTPSGYNVLSKAISAGTKTTGFDWSDVTRVGVSANSSYVIMDGLRFDNVNPIDTNRGMISRAVLPTPITKLANIPVDIEYTLRIGFNG